MKKKILIGVGVAVVALSWYAFRPELLFVNKSVSESFPVASAAANSPVATSEAHAFATGDFKGYAHETHGTAAIYEVEGKRVLRLTNFMTSNGPDVHVYLVAAPDAKDDATVKKAGYIDLGSMKGNVGDQNYDVPNNLDLKKYQAVTIWCARFSVNFATAPLTASL